MQSPEELRASALKSVLSVSSDLRQISLAIHSHPELAYQEFYAYQTVVDFLIKKGFRVTQTAGDISTAFVCEYIHGSGEKGGVCVGFCSEYDALPEIGHACGHNLICILGIASFLACVDAMIAFNISGTVRLFGTPAEEGKGGKVAMLNKDLFAGVDVCLMAHPGNINLANARYLAMQSVHAEFSGVPAHASAAPWEGKNALDALVNSYVSLSTLRQQITPTSRIHGIVTSGGVAPNVIPDATKAHYYIRTVKKKELEELMTRVEQCFHAGALSTGCSVRIPKEPPFYDVIQNPILVQSWRDHMTVLGATFPYATPAEEESVSRGSTDMGNVTHAIPGFHPVFDIGCDREIHSVEFREAAKTERAHERTLRCAAAIAAVGLQVLISGRDGILVDIIKQWKKDTEQ